MSFQKSMDAEYVAYLKYVIDRIHSSRVWFEQIGTVSEAEKDWRARGHAFSALAKDISHHQQGELILNSLNYTKLLEAIQSECSELKDITNDRGFKDEMQEYVDWARNEVKAVRKEAHQQKEFARLARSEQQDHKQRPPMLNPSRSFTGIARGSGINKNNRKKPDLPPKPKIFYRRHQ